MTMTREQALELAQSLVDQIEREMMDVNPDAEPFALLVLQTERVDALRLLAQTTRRVEAQRAREADAERRNEALRRAETREQLWAEWQTTIRFLSRSAMTPKLKSSIIRKFGIDNYLRLRP
jgi:hypothetical protein